MNLPSASYDVKPKQEGAWGSASLILTYVLMQLGVDAYVAAAAGVLVRPVGGYLIRFLPDPPASETGAAWTFRVGYLFGALVVLAFEIIAIANDGKDDTITENVRNVIFLHPVVWYSLLGLYLGFGVWMTRHFWWREK